MKCEEGQKLLNEFMDHELAPEAAAAMRAHIDSCSACAAELAALEKLRLATSSLARDIEPELDFWSEIESALGPELMEEVKQGRARVYGWSSRGLGWRAVVGGFPKWNAIGYLWRLGVAAAAVVLVVVGIRAWRGGGASDGAAWEVTTLAGAPSIESRDVSAKGTLRQGEWLETDAASRARVEVANIGHVTVGPASAIRLKGSSEQEHRIELARGEVSAFIWSPPRLFFVETPSGVAEDLGCQYHLAVDPEGNGALEVTLGFVSFQREGREVIVPAGARCELRAGVGPGTPHENDATQELRDALARVDFAGAAAADIDAVLHAATEADAVTLWHLIPRVDGENRARVVDQLASWVPLPEQTTRDGVIALDEKMLERWWEEIYPSWSHWN